MSTKVEIDLTLRALEYLFSANKANKNMFLNMVYGLHSIDSLFYNFFIIVICFQLKDT